MASNRVQVNLRNEVTDKQLFSGAVGGSNVAGRWTLDYTVQRNANLVDEPNDNWELPGGHLGGFDNPVPMLTVPNLWLDLNGPRAFSTPNRNDSRFFALDEATTFMSEYQSDFTLRERVAAALAMARIDIGRARLIGGLRAEAAYHTH